MRQFRFRFRGLPHEWLPDVGNVDGVLIGYEAIVTNAAVSIHAPIGDQIHKHARMGGLANGAQYFMSGAVPEGQVCRVKRGSSLEFARYIATNPPRGDKPDGVTRSPAQNIGFDSSVLITGVARR